MTDSRGQAQTLEAFASAIVLLSVLVFALEVTAVTPLTASTASQHIENQQAAVGQGVLDAAAENGTLKPTVLYWNNSSGCFHGVPHCGPYSTGPPTEFGRTLNDTFIERGIAFDLNVVYVTENGDLDRQKIVDMGLSSDNAVTVRRTLTLYEDDRIFYANNTRSSLRLNESSTFREDHVDQGDPDGQVYNVIQVELVIWRM